MLLRRDGAIERLPATATVLGLFEDWKSPTVEVGLFPGDALVIFSDGVTEAISDDGEQFGEGRLLEALWTHRHLAPGELLNTVVATVQEFSGPEQADDLTLLVAGVH